MITTIIIIIIIIIIINLICIAQFDTNGILTAMYIVASKTIELPMPLVRYTELKIFTKNTRYLIVKSSSFSHFLFLALECREACIKREHYSDLWNLVSRKYKWPLLEVTVWPSH